MGVVRGKVGGGKRWWREKMVVGNVGCIFGGSVVK